MADSSAWEMYAHARNNVRIFELYQDVSHACQAALGPSVVNYFGYLQSRWEELAQYEPLSDLPPDILNTSTMPSLYEAYATINSYARRRHLGLLTHATVSTSSVITEQMAFAANSSPRPPSWQPFSPGCAIAETTGNSAALSDFSMLQAQIGQIQDQLGSLATRAHDTPIAPIATIATRTPTAFYVRSGEPTWVLDSGANDHMTDLSSKKIFGKGYERDGLYYFGDPPTATSGHQASVLPSPSSHVFSFKTLTLWHARLGHTNFQYVVSFFYKSL
uniref:GAG-pre-integrase domain-containing protein n=1 Tax=Fagus sylvatica TaxID=28930 RepID=A0A2N9IN76_FAGSY